MDAQPRREPFSESQNNQNRPEPKANHRDLLASARTQCANELANLGDSLLTERQPLHSTELNLSNQLLENFQLGCYRASQYLKQNDSKKIFQDTRQFISKRPEIALGTLFISGLFLSRALKSRPKSESDYE